MAEAVDEWAETPSIEAQTWAYLKDGFATLWDLTKSEHGRIKVALGLLFFNQCINALIPLLVAQMVAYATVLEREGTTDTVFETLFMFFGVMCLLKLAALILHHKVQEPIFLKALINLENYWPMAAHHKLLALSLNYHERENTGKKIAKVNKGTEKMVGILSDGFWGFCPQIFYLIANVANICLNDWRLGLLFVAPIPIAVWIQLRSYRKYYHIWEEWEHKKEESIGLFCQSIINVRTVQHNVAESREQETHDRIRKHMGRIDYESANGIQNYYFGMNAVLFMGFALSLLAGFYFIATNTGSVQSVALVAMVGLIVVMYMWGIVQVYTRFLRHIVAAQRMHELLEEGIDVANALPGIVPRISSGVLEYQDVSTIYPGRENPVIDHFNLVIPEGEMLAFVGPSGSGKSTLVNLLARVIDVTDGAILLDGNDIRSIDRNWYRARYAFVPQDVEIFDGTIYQNVVYANPEAPEEYVRQAIKAASLEKTLADPNRFPDGWDTEIGERGVRLSGGERQRVGIARAYVARLCGAKVLILDEATSSLDSESERDIQEFLEASRQERSVTIIVIAHRLSTIKKADRICVLDSGKIVELGDHNTLLKQNGLYHRLVRLQELGAIRE